MKRIARRRRSDWLHEGNDDPLAQLAAELITRALDKRWRAMVLTSVVVAAVVSLAIVLPITFWQDSETNAAASVRAQHNCALITRVATIMGSGDRRDPHLKRGGFLSSDANLRATEARRAAEISGTGPLASLLSDPETRKLEAQNAGTETSVLTYWRHDLIPALLAAAHADCSG